MYSCCRTTLIFADGIVSYMKKQAGPSSVALHSEPELDAFINGFYASVVGELLSCYYPYGGYRKNKEYSKSWISLCIHVRWLGT